MASILPRPQCVKHTLQIGETDDLLSYEDWWPQPQLRTLVPCAISGISLIHSQLHHVLSVNDTDISFILPKHQYQLSDFSSRCAWQLWSLFERSTEGWLYSLRKATLLRVLTIDPMVAVSCSSSVTMVNWKHHELKLHSEHHPSKQIGS